MTTQTNASDPVNHNRTRLGAGLLLGGVLLVTVRAVMGNILFPTTFKTTTTAELANNIATHSGTVTSFAYLGAFAGLLLCIGGFLLATRSVSTRNGFPSSSLWIAFAVAQLVTMLVYAFYGTGYVTLAKAFSTTAPLSVTMFETARSTLAFTGILTGLLAYGSLMGVWFGESRNATASIPIGVAWSGVLFTTLSFVGVLCNFFGAVAIGQALSYAFYPGVLVALLFTVRVAWPNMSMSSNTTTSRHTA